MPENHNSEIVVRSQNFDKAMRSIKRITDENGKFETIDRVETSGGLFWLGDHKVTGSELNQVVRQVEKNLIDLNDTDHRVFDALTEVYKALNALDKEHIFGIMSAAKAATEASKTATRNVENIDKIVKVLQEFKAKLEKLEHLMEIDKVWEILLLHEEVLSSLQEFKGTLCKLVHLHDVDVLWDNSVAQETTIQQLRTALDTLRESISQCNLAIENITENQKYFFAAMQKYNEEQQVRINIQLEETESHLTEKINQLEDFQKIQILKLAKRQADIFAQNEKKQEEAFENLYQLLEEEKKAFHERICTLNRRVEILYFIAGSATVISIAQLILTVLGVL